MSYNENLMNVDELSEFLPDHPKPQTIYNWVSMNKIPFEKKSKRLFFDKKKIERWDKYGRPENIGGKS